MELSLEFSKSGFFGGVCMSVFFSKHPTHKNCTSRHFEVMLLEIKTLVYCKKWCLFLLQKFLTRTAGLRGGGGKVKMRLSLTKALKI
jgi:hypothetical protein